MHALKRFWPIALGPLFALVIAGCGATPTAGLGGGASAATATPAPKPPVVQTASVPIKGTATTVLTDGQGKTLYYFDPDSTSQATCTSSDGCAQTWPAFLTHAVAPASPSGVSGLFSIVNGNNGVQVMYNGHPLYTFSGDSGAGQANGDGYMGKWHAATPNTPQNPNSGSGGGSSY